MVWYLISMMLGALVFGAGIVFEKLVSVEHESTAEEDRDECPDGDVDPELFRQWQNLLNYDGTEQEEMKDEDR